MKLKEAVMDMYVKLQKNDEPLKQLDKMRKTQNVVDKVSGLELANNEWPVTWSLGYDNIIYIENEYNDLPCQWVYLIDGIYRLPCMFVSEKASHHSYDVASYMLSKDFNGILRSIGYIPPVTSSWASGYLSVDENWQYIYDEKSGLYKIRDEYHMELLNKSLKQVKKGKIFDWLFENTKARKWYTRFLKQCLNDMISEEGNIQDWDSKISDFETNLNLAL